MIRSRTRVASSEYFTPQEASVYFYLGAIRAGRERALQRSSAAAAINCFSSGITKSPGLLKVSSAGLSRRVLGRKLPSIPAGACMPVCPPSPLPSIHLASSLPVWLKFFLYFSFLRAPLSVFLSITARTPLTVTPSHLSFASFSKPGCPINKHDHIVSLSCLLSIPALPPTHTRIHTAKQYHKSRDGRRRGGGEVGDAAAHTPTHFNMYCL